MQIEQLRVLNTKCAEELVLSSAKNRADCNSLKAKDAEIRGLKDQAQVQAHCLQQVKNETDSLHQRVDELQGLLNREVCVFYLSCTHVLCENCTVACMCVCVHTYTRLQLRVYTHTCSGSCAGPCLSK